MKKLLLSGILSVFFLFCFSQNQKAQIPSVEVKTLELKTFNTSEISNDKKPIVLSFWATWCKPCIKELDAIAENYEDWQEETGVKVVAISIDNSRSMGRVSPFVNGKDWDYEVYLDPNGDFKRAMNVVNVPHTFLIDENGKIVWQHTTYADGDEEELYELIKKLAAGEEIKH
ncbi:MAG: TlpA family protein disulfide reductase [Bacteroidetes bacterium]|jgi:peroxiredoxin|nr:TlpA family protein disulfide reductase [Bacteroidota bacterium]MBT6685352.1 TlpA family protein disulfide reductase [Bacteroidota bacterium]MBT7145068.1 TlpA family protein disulfide reductase [Bacteroidota bacterium]MBT7492753.1 TlpA family protein disulfide reductase [Bacteroidota bacterium]